MKLDPGERLGPYEILSTIGAGGMGVVYKARDTRLDRTVAIKVLPPHIAAQPEARRRFEREARAVSSLNHPHICTLFDIGRERDLDYIVMEFLDGETLAHRVSRGALSVAEAMHFGGEIASALDRAHRNGVLHRDLKPANVMITRDGAKLLDFGLAKSRPVRMEGGDEAAVQALTGHGTILGTPQYMSPEQIQGRDSDARGDVFSFGCLLYEMLTGKRAFDGTNPASVIASVLAAEPRALTELQPIAPPALDKVVRRALAKEPEDRWQSAGDVMAAARLVCESAQEAAPPPPPPPPPQRRLWREAIAVSFFFLIAAGVVLWRLSLPGEGQLLRLAVPMPPGASFQWGNSVGGQAISPDGNTLAFVAAADGPPRLWLRRLDSPDSVELAGTDNAYNPFWSPDSRTVAFFAAGKLKRVDTAGGAPAIICDVGAARGGSWNTKGVILISPRPAGGIHRVSAAGGVPEPVTKLDSSRRDRAHYWPHWLADGRRFLYTAMNPRSENDGVYLADIEKPEGATRLTSASYKAEAAAAGGGEVLLWVRGKSLLAQRISGNALSGDAVTLLRDVDTFAILGAANFSLSRTGALSFGAASSGSLRMVWMDRAGKELAEAGKASSFSSPRVSPDGRRIALNRDENNGSDIWIADPERGVDRRLTFSPELEFFPAWSADGKYVAYSGGLTSPIVMKDVSGAGQPKLLSQEAAGMISDWSRDGRNVVYTTLDEGGRRDVMAIPAAGGKPIAVAIGPFDARNGRFSPDGRWIAYMAEETGRFEVFVQPFPPDGSKWQVTQEGAAYPQWSHDGRELFYVTESGRLTAIAVETRGGSFSAGKPQALFSLSRSAALGINPIDVAPDGRFLVLAPVSRDQAEALSLLINWPSLLKR